MESFVAAAAAAAAANAAERATPPDLSDALAADLAARKEGVRARLAQLQQVCHVHTSNGESSVSSACNACPECIVPAPGANSDPPRMQVAPVKVGHVAGHRCPISCRHHFAMKV